MKRFPVLLAVLLFSGGSSHAGELDPAGFSESMPGASWKRVMKEFRKLDRNDDGLISRAEREIEGEVHKAYRGLYEFTDHAQESLPLKWTTGVNLVWDDGVMTTAEFWNLLATVRSLPTGQRVAAQRSWLLLRKMLKNREEDESVSSVVGAWAQSDPAGVAAWLQNFPDRGR
jgi:hypothetical protein